MLRRSAPIGGSVRNHHTKRLFDRTRNRPWGTSTRKANDPDARAWTRLEQTPAPPAWKPSFTDLTKTCVGRMVGPTAITVGLRPRYVTIFIVMDVAAGRRAVNKYVHSLGVAPLPRLRRLPCVLLTHINHWDAWERCGKVVGKTYSICIQSLVGPAQCGVKYWCLGVNSSQNIGVSALV